MYIGRDLVSSNIIPIYWPNTDSIANKNEKNKRNKPTIVPKPSNGTPKVNHLYVCIDSNVIAETEHKIVNKIESLNGKFEKAKSPLVAKLIWVDVVAFDIPENLCWRSNSTPIVLNPTHEKKPL